MSKTQLIRTMRGDAYYNLFEDLPLALYSKDSPRFVIGNDPVDLHLEGCYVLLENEKAVGRFSLYENPDLTYKEKSAASIGSYECVDSFSISGTLINHAKELAKSKGYEYLIGPMEGSTWNNYRFSTKHESAPFFMEPYHHLYYNHQFLNAGFATIATYSSNKTENMNPDEGLIEAYSEKLAKEKLTLRSLNLDNLQEDLERLADMTAKSFSENFLYTPIQADDFIRKNQKLKRFMDPRLTIIIEDEQKEIHAFLFAIKDHLDPSGETLILKSMARKRDTPLKGVGLFFSHVMKQRAGQMGFKNIIHAFMHDENVSQSLSEKHGIKKFKSYSLYGIAL